MARADEIARGLVAHLRGALGEPGLELAERPVPLTGGFDTEIHAVRLRGAPADFSGPLVLRMLRAHHDPAMVLREQAIQNALAVRLPRRSTVPDTGARAPQRAKPCACSVSSAAGRRALRCCTTPSQHWPDHRLDWSTPEQ